MARLDTLILFMAWIIIIHQFLAYVLVTVTQHQESFSSARIKAVTMLQKLSIYRNTSHSGYQTSEIQAPVYLLSNIPMYGSSAYHWKNTITNLATMGVRCQRLQEGKLQYASKLSKLKKIVLGPPFYQLLTMSCDSYIKTRGYITKSTNDEWRFPIAFGILMYNDIEMAERLLRAIYRPSNFYCIHIDEKTSPTLRQVMSSIAGCFKNVFISSRSVHVTWGRYSVFEADLVCMDEMRKIPGWKYYINLAGQDFPLKTNLEIMTILKSLNGSNCVSGIPYSKTNWKIRMSATNHTSQPKNLTFMKGSQHIIANRKFINYMRTAPEALLFADWLKPALHPHETFYNTLYFSKKLQIPGCYNGTQTNLPEDKSIARYKIWKLQHKPCSGKWVRAICIFGLKELPLLTQTQHLFANKFHSDFQPVVLDCLEKWMFDKIKQEQISGVPQINVSYYKNLDTVRNKMCS